MILQAGYFNGDGSHQRFFSRATKCDSCGKGEYQPNEGSSDCRTCATGRVSGEGATSCTDCPAGQYQDEELKDSCKECPAGRAEGSTGSTGCNSCPEGFYAPKGATSCVRCQRGRYGDEKGLESCKLCDVGRASRHTGQTHCHDCGRGRYQASTGGRGCPRCPGGYYQPDGGQGSCFEADAGYYAPEGARLQTECPRGRYASVPGSHEWRCEGPVRAGRYSQETALTSSTAGELCPPGRYGRPGETHEDCTGRCPAGFFCEGGTGIEEWKNCGDISVYCPYGSREPRKVPDGAYASGPAHAQRSSRTCELGYYCIESRRYECPAGRYGDDRGITSPTCTGDCEHGFECKEGSSSPRQEECSPEGNPLYYCRNGIKFECPDGYTTSNGGGRKTRSNCHPCPHRFRCYGGERLEKIQWLDDFCRHRRVRDTMYVPTVEKEDSPQNVGPIFSTTVRVQYDSMEYFVASIVQDGRTLEGGTCDSDVTNESPLTMWTTIDSSRDFDGVVQRNGQLRVKEGEKLKFADCGRYNIRIGATIVESDVEESGNVSATVTEFCTFTLVVEHVNSPPEKLPEFGSIDDPVKVEVFRGVPFDSSFGDELSPMFIDPDRQELTFTLHEEDRAGDPIAEHPFTIGACTGQLKVNDPLMLIQTPYDEFKLAILVSDNAPDDPGELLQEVIVTVIQPNRPPEVAEVPPVLFGVELSPPGTQITTEEDPLGNNITSLVHPAFVTDPDGDTIEVVFDPCSRENYCSAFSLTASGNLTVKDPRFLSFSRPLDLVRFVRVRYSDGKADAVPALLDIQILQLREAPVITIEEATFPEDIGGGEQIRQLTAEDRNFALGGQNFDFVLQKARNNKGQQDNRITVASDGTTNVTAGAEFNSILCAASGCVNCTTHDLWIDITVTAEILERPDSLPGPVISEPTVIRFMIALVNQAPYYIAPENKVTVKENVEEIELLDLSNHFCDREDQTMFYSIANDADNLAMQFSLSSSGILEITDQFDYEEIQQVDVPIVVQDTGSPSGEREISLTVYIIDVPEPPILNESHVLAVDELSTHEDGIFGTILVSDPDIYAGTDRTFASLKSEYQFQQTNLLDKFDLRQDGSISIRPGFVPDYETLFLAQDGEASYSLQFAVVDIVNNMTTEFTVDINILDIPEPPYFDPTVQNFTINVFSEGPDTLGHIEATTPDFGDTVEVFLVQTPRRMSDGTSAPFSIELRRSGRLSLTPDTKVELSEEDVHSWFFFYVQAIDTFGLNITSRHFIEVTNPPEPPFWNSPFDSTTPVVEKEIDEHYEDNGGIYEEFSPKCTDPNGRGVQFQILSVNPSLYDNIFGFSRSGQLSVERPNLLDYEPLKRADDHVVSFDVVCIDSFNLQTELIGKLRLTVMDIPEPPEFVDVSSVVTLSVKEDVAMGFLLENFSAFDQDFDSQHELTFELSNNDNDGDVPFSIGSPTFTNEGHTATVQLSVTSNLDFYRKSSYSFTLTVADEGGKTDERRVDIEIVFVNTPPVFDNATYTISAFEDVTNENVLARGLESFPFYDRNRDTSHTFSVLWSSPAGLLTFVSNGLRLASGRRVNYEQIWFHEFGIRVTDGEGLYDEVNVTLIVKNVNDIKIDELLFEPHSTTGGSVTTFIGEDLGPIWRSATITATILSPGGHMQLDSVCSRTELVDGWKNTEVECVVPAGVGKRLQWTLRIDDDEKVAPSTTNFKLPVLTGIAGWPQEASTEGGQTFLLEGQNFGPEELPSPNGMLKQSPINVQYESSADGRVGTMTASGCFVKSDVHIQCMTVQGAGSDLQFRVQTAHSSNEWKQASKWIAGGASYAPPNIDVVTPLSRELPTTGLSEAFWLEGSNFGPDQELISSRIVNDWKYWGVTCIRQNHTFLLCDLPEGMGSNYVWEITVADQISARSAADQSISYDAPVFESIRDISGNSPQDMNTQGNEFIYPHGSNFGPGVGEAGGVGINVRYGDKLQYTAASCVVERAHTRIRCLTVPGIGANQSWILSVGNQTSNELIGVSNYHPPVVATYSRPGSNDVGGIDDLRTPGHENITLRGRHFGPPGTQIDEAIYGAENFTLTALGCEVQSFTTMVCLTSPGAGSQHFWTVKVGGQTSDVATTSYERPIISGFQGVNGSNPQKLSTMGGEFIDIIGENFGPPELSEMLLESVLYGPNGNAYRGSQCVVLTHERVRCKTAAGHGQHHRWIVIVAGQNSDFSVVTTSYAPPVLHFLSPNHGPTGFYSTREDMPSLILNGTDLGANLVQQLSVKVMIDTDGHLQRLRDQAVVSDRDDLLADVLSLQQADPSTFLQSIENLGFPPAAFEDWLDDILSIEINSNDIDYEGEEESSYQKISITLPEGFGRGRSVFIIVGETYSLPLTFDYDPPYIDAVSPAIQSDSEIMLTVFGRNFCGGQSCEGTECCGLLIIDGTSFEVPPDQYFHDEIDIMINVNSLSTSSVTGHPKGEVEIHVVDQPTQSNIKAFEQPLPEIPRQEGRVQLSGFRTRGGELFLLYDIKEINEQHGSEDIRVTIGDKECTNLQVTSTFVEERGSSQTSFGNISCLTPPHMGRNLPVALSVSGSGDDPRSRVEVDYAPPEICFVELNDSDSEVRVVLFEQNEDCVNDLNLNPIPDIQQNLGVPTTGGNVIVRGSNFGSSDLDLEPWATVPEIADAELLQHDHEIFGISVPPGAGGSNMREVRILVSDFQPSFRFHYTPPNIESITPSEIPTNPSLSDRIYIVGTNFGPPTGSLAGEIESYQPEVTVTVDGNDCKVVGSNHSFIECVPPEGQGKDIKVVVNVEGQETVSDELQYKMPSITSMTPTTGPTSGKANGNPVNVTLVGKNFGTEGGVHFMGDNAYLLHYDHEKIIFLLPEGFGEDVTVSVLPIGWKPDDLADGTATIKFSYELPTISAIFRVDGTSRQDCEPFERCTTVGGEKSCVLEHPDCFPTSGDVQVEVFGNNFGPGDTWTNPSRNPPTVRVVIEGQEGTVLGEKVEETSHEQLFFTLPEGIGQDKAIQVMVNDRMSVLSPNDSVTFSYDPPRISNIMPNNPDAIGSSIQFRGANFGPVGSPVDIRLSNVTCLGAQVRESHTLITCEMQPDYVGPKRIDMDVAERKVSFPAWLELFVSECKRGWYGLQGETCVFCEEEQPGAICPGNERWIDLVYSDEGWWRFNRTTPHDRCHPERLSREKCPVFMPCEPSFACLGDNTCAREYAGVRCSQCADGFFRIGGLCQSCPDHAWLLALGLALAVVGVCVGGYIINSKGIRLAAFTIGVDYFQVIALFAGTRVRWPETMERTLQALSFFNLNIELAAPECWMSPPPTFEIRWMATMIVPLLAFGLLTLVYVCIYLYKLLVLRNPSYLRHRHVHALVATAVVILYILYIFVTRQTLDIFNCAPTDPPDGNLYMAGRTDIVCGQSSVHVNLLLPLASVALVLYVSAFPIFSLVLLKKNKERVKHDQILRAHETGTNRLTNPNYTFRRRFQRLYHLFKPGKWYWVLLILFRKFMIAFTSLMFRTSPVYQLSMTLLVIFGSYVLQVKHQPYMSGRDFQGVVEEHQKKVREGDKLHVRIQSTMDEVKAKNIERLQSCQGWEAQQERLKEERGHYLLSEKVVQYLTDFNTVEAILLASAILVNLFGIMFLSSRFDGDSLEFYRSDFEVLGVLCMIVVCTSCVYWLLVFGFEMLATFHPKAAIRVVSACSCKRGDKVTASASGGAAKLGPSQKGRRFRRKRDSKVEMQNNPLSSAVVDETKLDASNSKVEDLERQLKQAKFKISELKKLLEGDDTKVASTPGYKKRAKRQFPQFKANKS